MRERLQGLALILAGCVSLALVSFVQLSGWLQALRPAPPPGVPGGLLPLLNPLYCLLFLVLIGALGLLLVGVKKLLAPDDRQPPKHLG